MDEIETAIRAELKRQADTSRSPSLYYDPEMDIIDGTLDVSALVRILRQANAKIEVTPEMVAEGVRTLERHVNLDDHPPIYSLEEIVEWIFKAMERCRAAPLADGRITEVAATFLREAGRFAPRDRETPPRRPGR